MRYYAVLSWYMPGEFEEMCAAGAEGTSSSGDEIRNDFQALIPDAVSKQDAFEQACRMAKVDWETVDGRVSYYNVWEVPFLTLRELVAAKPVHSLPGESKWEYIPSHVLTFFDIDDYHFDDEGAMRIAKMTGEFRIDYYVNACFDGRRGIEMGCVFFMNEPVVVFQRSGRDMCEYTDEWLISRDRKVEVTKWLSKFLRSDGDDWPEEADLDEENPGLSFFYGYSVAETVEKYHKEKK